MRICGIHTKIKDTKRCLLFFAFSDFARRLVVLFLLQEFHEEQEPDRERHADLRQGVAVEYVSCEPTEGWKELFSEGYEPEEE